MSAQHQEVKEVDVSTPTETSPEVGYVLLGGELLSQTTRFVDEHGTHVIRSKEFDVYGEGDTFVDAAMDFCEHTVALLEYLAALVDEGDATEDELRVAALLGTRLAAAREAVVRELEAKSRIEALFDAALRSRQRGKRERLDWQTHLKDSSRLLPV